MNMSLAMQSEQRHFDVIVIGGNFAGLSAALQIARTRRQVLVIDAGKPRNRFAASSHGFLGHDGDRPHKSLKSGMSNSSNIRQPILSKVQQSGQSAIRLILSSWN